MKKIYTILAMFSLACALQAQMTVTGSEPVTALPGEASAAKTTGVRDTLNFHVERASSFTIYTTTSGYLLGTGSDGLGASYSEETGYYFDSVGDVTVNEIYFWMARKKIIGSPDFVEARLYEPGIDSLPTVMLANGSANMAFLDSSSTVTLSTLSGFALIPLSAGTLNVNAPFIVTIAYAGIDDTLGIVSNVQGDALGERRGLFLSTISFGGGWMHLADFWNIGGDPFDADPIIVPIVEFASTTAIEDQVFQGKNFSFRPASPNPAQTEATVNVELKEGDLLHLQVLDATGRTVYDNGSPALDAGTHTFVLPVEDWASGAYYYSVSTSKNSITSKLVVTH